MKIKSKKIISVLLIASFIGITVTVIACAGPKDGYPDEPLGHAAGPNDGYPDEPLGGINNRIYV